MWWLNHLDNGWVWGALMIPGKIDFATHAKIHIPHNTKPLRKLFWLRYGVLDAFARDGQNFNSFDTVKNSQGVSSL